ncbi:MAG: TolC family protein [Acidobacteriia bacterium]|nr:TolC family protein [Terriglobia bacterium]
MNVSLPRWFRLVNLLLLSVVALAGEQPALAESLPFQRAIELALAHSTTSAIANADLQRADAAYREIRNTYSPQLMVGSGLGYSYGFPLSLEGSAPALVNLVAQSTVFNPAQRQFMKAAKTDWRASQAQSQDQRNAVIQDVALSYVELAKWEGRLSRLLSDEAQAQQMEKAVAQRVQEGVDSAVDLNKAKLSSARVRLHMAEARGSADLLRRHLGELTGLPLSSIAIAPETIPALPPVSSEDDLGSQAVTLSPAVRFAEQHAVAESMRASAEHRALLPSLDFAAQYARLSTYNNYDQYFKTFQPNNVTIGMSFRFPVFNASQRARAQAADAEAVKARKQAEAARNKVHEETLKLQRTAEQLDAAREVAQLEYQLAQSSLDAAQIRVDAKTGTLHELADARAQANERYLAFQDAEFEYQRVRLSLLRATGDLEKWSLQTAGK